VLAMIDGARLDELVPVAAAVDALRRAARDGAPTSGGPARTNTLVRAGHLLLMPAEDQEFVGVKVTGVAPANPERGLPRITGTYLLHDAATLQPVVAIDGAALTLLRTAALSALAVDELATPDTRRVMLFGTGPQAAAHIRAVSTVRDIDQIAVAGRTPDATATFVQRWAGTTPVRPATQDDVRTADLVLCCTSSPTPLFDGRQLASHATVVAMGSHTLDARELDTHTLRRSTVVVEDRDTAIREAADVAAAVADGDLTDVIPLATVLTGARIDRGRPRIFRSVGMAWEDLAVAGAACRACRGE
jgi:ornithine cyclodeaminase/alanine dehydrogenase-like protein (mu-crystallin family)